MRSVWFVLVGQLVFFPLLFSQEALKPPRPGSSKWGATDERGAANRLTAEKVLEAVRLIKTGKVYQLGHVIEESMPRLQNRSFVTFLEKSGEPRSPSAMSAAQEHMFGTLGHIGTQLDGFGHVGIGGFFYNGYNYKDIQTQKGLTKIGIEKVGVFLTRGVLLDIPALKGVKRLEKAEAYEITAADLKEAVTKQKVTIRPGDVVLIHTGMGSLWDVPDGEYNSGSAPGIGVSAAYWLAEQQISLVGADTRATEVIPPGDRAGRPVHQILLALNGIYNMENVVTSELAQDRVYEFAFFFAPLRLKGYTGSPASPVAIR